MIQVLSESDESDGRAEHCIEATILKLEAVQFYGILPWSGPTSTTIFTNDRFAIILQVREIIKEEITHRLLHDYYPRTTWILVDRSTARIRKENHVLRFRIGHAKLIPAETVVWILPSSPSPGRISSPPYPNLSWDTVYYRLPQDARESASNALRVIVANRHRDRGGGGSPRGSSGLDDRSIIGRFWNTARAAR